MIYYSDKRIDEINKKRIYLLDKINAYFKQVTEHKSNPTKSKKKLVNGFDNKVDKALEIFK